MSRYIDIRKYQLSDMHNLKRVFEQHNFGITELGKIFNQKLGNEIGHKVYCAKISGIDSWSVHMYLMVDDKKYFGKSQKSLNELKEFDVEYKILRILHEGICQKKMEPIDWKEISPHCIRLTHYNYIQQMRMDFVYYYILHTAFLSVR